MNSSPNLCTGFSFSSLTGVAAKFGAAHTAPQPCGSASQLSGIRAVQRGRIGGARSPRCGRRGADGRCPLDVYFFLFLFCDIWHWMKTTPCHGTMSIFLGILWAQEKLSICRHDVHPFRWRVVWDRVVVWSLLFRPI